MTDRTVRDIMTAPAVTVGPETGLEEAARTMLDREIGCLPVVDDRGRLVGIVTDGDFIARDAGVPFSVFRAPQLLGTWLGDDTVEEIYEKARSRPVKEIMTRRVHTVAPDDALRRVLDVMLDRDVKHVPVVEDDELVGVVARHDLMRLLQRERG